MRKHHWLRLLAAIMCVFGLMSINTTATATTTTVDRGTQAEARSDAPTSQSDTSTTASQTTANSPLAVLNEKLHRLNRRARRLIDRLSARVRDVRNKFTGQHLAAKARQYIVGFLETIGIVNDVGKTNGTPNGLLEISDTAAKWLPDKLVEKMQVWVDSVNFRNMMKAAGYSASSFTTEDGARVGLTDLLAAEHTEHRLDVDGEIIEITDGEIRAFMAGADTNVTRAGSNDFGSEFHTQADDTGERELVLAGGIEGPMDTDDGTSAGQAKTPVHNGTETIG